MIAAVVLPDDLRERIAAEARAAYPRECCGLVEGIRGDKATTICAIHPTVNLAEQCDRFQVDPAAQFALLRCLRGSGREIVGCYHSHPEGRAEPSGRDRAGASEEEFVWLIAALDARQTISIGAFLYEHSDFRPLSLVPVA